MKPAIRVEGLGKQYKLGHVHTDLLSEKLGNGLRGIGNWFRGSTGASKAQTTKAAGDTFWALKDVNFEVQPGEVMGVIGRNGAGKSTLLRILSRITSPTIGEVHLQGRVASLLEVGTGFHPELTGRENIFLNGAILGMTRREINSKFDEIVSFAAVEKFIDTPVKRYSSGMYVRLAFAVAAHLEPEILVVDEVLAVGDVAFQKKCLSKMEDVSGEGRTVLFVSHNMSSIKRLCHSAIVLEEGRIGCKADAHHAVTEYYRRQEKFEPRVTFSPSQHRARSGFQITALELLDRAQNPVGQVCADEPVIFSLQIAVKEHCNSVRVGISIHREGTLISVMHCTPRVFHPSQLNQQITCEVPASLLLPGFYQVHVGAHEAQTGRGLDWIPDAFSFQVLDIESHESAHIDERDKGLIRIRPQWTFGSPKTPFSNPCSTA